MKTAISNIAWANEFDEPIADRMAAAGVLGVEVAPTKRWPDLSVAPEAELRAFRDLWESRGLRVVAMQALLYGRPDLRLFEDAATRERTLEYLRAGMRVAAALGAGVLVFGSPKNRRVGDFEPERARAIAVDFFGAAGRAASELGVELCLEPNPEAYACDFVTHGMAGRDLVREVGEDGFGLHLDAAGMHLAGDDLDATIEACATDLRHFHASEPYLGPLGEGGVDHARCAAALRRIGYGHWVSVEMRPPDGRDPLTEMERVLGVLQTHYGAV